MDDSKIYLQGKEVVTPYYLNKVKEELSKKLEVSQNFVNEFRFLIMDDPESISKEYFDTVLLPEAKVVGWEKVIVVFSHTIAYNAMGFFMFNKKSESTDASGNVTQTITFETIHPNIYEQKKSYYTSGALSIRPTVTQIVLTIMNDEFAGASFDYKASSDVEYVTLPIHEDARTATKSFTPVYDAEPTSKKYSDLTSKYRFSSTVHFWREGMFLNLGDLCFYDGEFYECISAMNTSSDTTRLTIPPKNPKLRKITDTEHLENATKKDLLTSVTEVETKLKDSLDSLYFEGNSNEWNALTASEQDGFLISIIEPIAETDEPVEEILQGIFKDETPTETEDDLTEDEANIQLDRIIKGGE